MKLVDGVEHISIYKDLLSDLALILLTSNSITRCSNLINNVCTIFLRYIHIIQDFLNRIKIIVI
jgi:hypothetical protein